MSKNSKEIEISSELLVNKNIKAKLGTQDNKSCPETIYLTMNFWIKPKENVDISTLKSRFETDINKIYRNKIKNLLSNSQLFPKKNENIFIVNIPEKVGQNEKKNFISLELYLHTCNLNKENKKISLSDKNMDYSFLDEGVKIINNFLEEPFFGDKSYCNFFQKSK